MEGSWTELGSNLYPNKLGESWNPRSKQTEGDEIFFKWKIGCQQINSPITLVFLQQKLDETMSF